MHDNNKLPWLLSELFQKSKHRVERKLMFITDYREWRKNEISTSILRFRYIDNWPTTTFRPPAERQQSQHSSCESGHGLTGWTSFCGRSKLLKLVISTSVCLSQVCLITAEEMQSCRLLRVHLKSLAGFATKNHMACMSVAVPEPIRKPDIKFAKVYIQDHV